MYYRNARALIVVYDVTDGKGQDMGEGVPTTGRPEHRYCAHWSRAQLPPIRLTPQLWTPTCSLLAITPMPFLVILGRSFDTRNGF